MAFMNAVREPVTDIVPRPLAEDGARRVDNIEQLLQVGEAHCTSEAGEVEGGTAVLLHVLARVRVDDLVAQRAEDEVWLLRHEQDVLPVRPDDPKSPPHCRAW